MSTGYDGFVKIKYDIDTKDANRSIDDISKRVENLREAKESLEKAGAPKNAKVYVDTVAELEKWEKELAVITQEQKKAAESANYFKREIEKYKNTLKELEDSGKYFGDAEYDRAYAALKRLEGLLKIYKSEVRETTDSTGKFTADIARLKTEIAGMERDGIGLGDAEYDKVQIELQNLIDKQNEYKKALMAQTDKSREEQAQRELAARRKLIEAEEAKRAKEAAAMAQQEQEERRIQAIRVSATASDEKTIALLERRRELTQRIAELESAGVGYGYREYDSIQKEIMSINAHLAEYQKKVLDSEKTTRTGFSKMADAVKKFTPALTRETRRSTGIMKTFASRMKGILLSLFIFNWITKGFNAMISGMKTGFENLEKYSSSYAACIGKMKSAMSTLGNSFAAAFSPIAEMVIPYLIQLINWINNAINGLAQLIAALTGKSTWTRAKKVLNETGEAAEKACSALAGFDKLNVLKQNNGSSSTDSSGGGFEEVPVGEEFANWGDKIREALSASFEGIGLEISTRLSNLLASINWDDVYDSASGFGKGLAQFLNGLLTPDLFGKIGSTIAGLLNTAIYSALSLGEEFDFEQFGSALAELVNDFFRDFDFEACAEAINTWVDGLGAAIGGFLEGLTWEDILSGVESFLGNLELDTIAVVVGAFTWTHGGSALTASVFKNLLGKQIGLGIGSETMSLGLSIALIITVAAISFEVGKELGKLLFPEDKELYDNFTWFGEGGFFDEIFSTDADILWNAAVEMVSDFADYVYEGTMENLEAWKEIGGNILAGIGEGIKEALGTAADFAQEVYEWVYNGICDVFGIHSPAEEMKPLGGYILSGIVEGFKGEIEEFTAAITEWWDESVAPWFTEEKWLELYNTVKAALEEKWEELVEWWEGSTLVTWFKEDVAPWFTKKKWTDLYNTVKETLQTKWNELVTWWKNSALYKWWNENVSPWFTRTRWVGLYMQIKNSLSEVWYRLVQWWESSALCKWWDENVAPWFKEKDWTSLLEVIPDAFESAFEKAVELANNIINPFIENVTKLIEDVKKMFGDVSTEATSLGEKAAGTTSGTKKQSTMSLTPATLDVPALANGAVIRGGNPYLAWLGDQPAGQTNIETPLPTMIKAFKQAMDESGTNGQGSYTFVAQLDGKTLFSETVKQERLYRKATGRNAFVH